MYKPGGLDRKSLQTQLENYKLIAQVNQELLDENIFTKGELPGKLALAQSYINESDQWEKLGDQTRCHDALTNANLIIVEVGGVIKLILIEETTSDESSLQMGQS
jgi:hypothetical protein